MDEVMFVSEFERIRRQFREIIRDCESPSTTLGGHLPKVIDQHQIQILMVNLRPRDPVAVWRRGETGCGG